MSNEMKLWGLPRSLRWPVVIFPVVGFSLAALAAVQSGFNPPVGWRWALAPGTFLGVMLAYRFPIRIRPGGTSVSLRTLPCLLAALLLPGWLGPATAAVSVFVVGLTGPGRWWDNWLYATHVLGAASLAALIGSFGSDVDLQHDIKAISGSALYLVASIAGYAVPAAAQSGRPWFRVMLRAWADVWPLLATLAACAVCIADLAIEAPLASPLPLLMLALVYRMSVAIDAQRQANEQLAGVLAAQRRFLTDVSHQVATPLATIMTNLSILKRDHRGGAERVAVLDSVAEAERMKRMLERLRALAHADEDVPLRRELVDLAELASDLVRAYAAQAINSGVDLKADVVAPARTSADKDLLREAVANLVDNAVRVSPQGASVILRVSHRAAGPAIAVIDQGPGLQRERLDHLFDRFQRSDSGSGLGLAIARRVAERHGGSIKVDTRPGGGSTFTIELPN